MGPISERTDLLRILLADQDDANAFLFQCGVNRLGRPCAFQRVSCDTQLAEKILGFRPDIVIAAGKFAAPGELRNLKQLANGRPIICAVHTHDEGEAAMAGGATDCVLVSQVDELHACIERHLHGTPAVPYYTRDLSVAPPAQKSPSKLDLKLYEFDRRVGAMLRRLGKTANLKATKLARASRTAWILFHREARKQYRALKVQWLLQKQKRLVRSNLLETQRNADFSPNSLDVLPRETAPKRPDILETARSLESNIDPRSARPPEASPKVRIVPSLSPAKPSAVPNPNPPDQEAFRTLELSFKTLFHASLDPVVLLDGLGSFLHANAAACTLLGLPPADLLGKSILDFVPSAERPQASSMWEALLIEGQQKVEMRLQTRSGDIREVFFSARSNLWFGVHLVIIRDQTEIKALRSGSSQREQAA